jgi:hypothetical protein
VSPIFTDTQCQIPSKSVSTSVDRTDACYSQLRTRIIKCEQQPGMTRCALIALLSYDPNVDWTAIKETEKRCNIWASRRNVIVSLMTPGRFKHGGDHKSFRYFARRWYKPSSPTIDMSETTDRKQQTVPCRRRTPAVKRERLEPTDFFHPTDVCGNAGCRRLQRSINHIAPHTDAEMKRVQRRDLMAFVEEALRVQPGCFFSF